MLIMMVSNAFATQVSYFKMGNASVLTPPFLLAQPTHTSTESHALATLDSIKVALALVPHALLVPNGMEFNAHL
jgi:hypothetical protein